MSETEPKHDMQSFPLQQAEDGEGYVWNTAVRIGLGDVDEHVNPLAYVQLGQDQEVMIEGATSKAALHEARILEVQKEGETKATAELAISDTFSVRGKNDQGEVVTQTLGPIFNLQ